MSNSTGSITAEPTARTRQDMRDKGTTSLVTFYIGQNEWSVQVWSGGSTIDLDTEDVYQVDVTPEELRLVLAMHDRLVEWWRAYWLIEFGEEYAA